MNLPGSSILARASYRYLLHHPWQLALALLGIALGIAVVVAVDLANEGARRSFELSTEMVVGSATHQIVSDGTGVPETLYTTLRTTLGVRRSAPIVEGNAGIDRLPGRTLQILGMDAFAESSWRGRLTIAGSASVPVAELLTTPGGALVPPGLPDRLGLAIGDAFEILAGAGRGSLTILGETPLAGPADSAPDLTIVDIATAQTLFGLGGRLSRIDLELGDGPEAEELAGAIEALLPIGVRLQSSAARNSAVASMSDSFQLNLTAMSLLALLVGMFLIYNTMTFAVIQRRPLLGRLRALGVSRGQLFRLVLSEALLLGLVGTAIGLALGIWIGHGLLDLVTRTIDDLYYSLTIRDFHLAPESLFKGIGLGITASLISAFLPAREAAASPPAAVLQRSDLEHTVRKRLPRLLCLAAIAFLAGGAILALPWGGIGVGFVGLFLFVLACTLCTPPVVAALAHLAARLAGRRASARMVARDLDRQLSRTGVAAAALMVAVASTVGLGVMIDSFRRSVEVWLDDLLVADVYVSPVSFGAGDGHVRLDPGVVHILRTLPEVNGVSTYKSRDVELNGRIATLIAVDLAPAARAGYRIAGDGTAAWQGFERENGVLISEPLAYHHGLSVGDSFTLASATGPVRLAVAGIYFSYGSEHGRVLIRASLYRDLWQDPSVRSAAVFAAPGVSSELLMERIRQLAAATYDIRLTPSGEIREASLRVFDRTFTVTGVLRILAVGVAFIGVLSALMALLLERSREFAVLRAMGVSAAQLGTLIRIQTGFLGLCAGLVAVPTGLLLGAILIFVINRRAFGWTMQFHADPAILLQALALAIVAALLAGVYPAIRASRSNVAEALQIE